MNASEFRKTIIRNYAAWTATAALRSGKHLKDGISLQKALEDVIVLNEIPTTQTEFDSWHARIVPILQKRVLALRSTETEIKEEKEFSLGWAAKLLNVYLKTLYYVGDFEPASIRTIIHPPIDNILIDAIIDEYGVSIWNSEKKFTIQGIEDYSVYSEMIDRLKQIAQAAKLENLTDIEHVWTSVTKKASIKSKYKLHEAMVDALKNLPGNQGSFEAIAKYINDHDSYTRKDGIKVPAFQIKLRAFMSNGRYRDMFEEYGKDGLRLRIK